MPKLRPGQAPSLRRHKSSGLAVVTLSGRDHYLGPWPEGQKQPPPDVVRQYDRLVAGWLASGRQGPPDTREAGRPDEPPHGGVTVGGLILRFWAHAERHYRRADGSPTSEPDNYRLSLRPLRKLYESLPADEFSPQKLKAVRQVMIDVGLNRLVINQRVGRIVRVFKWAVAEELVPVTVYQALKAVPGLQRGRTEAPEPEPVLPVPDDQVQVVLPHLLPEVAAMVRLQRLTGMRPGEVCQLRPCDLDRSAAVWSYRPQRHKMAYRGRVRTVPIGPGPRRCWPPGWSSRAWRRRSTSSPRDAPWPPCGPGRRRKARAADVARRAGGPTGSRASGTPP